MNNNNNKYYNLSKTYVNLNIDRMSLISFDLNTLNLLDFSSIILSYTDGKDYTNLTTIKYMWSWLLIGFLNKFRIILNLFPKFIFLNPIRPYLIHIFDCNGTYVGSISFYLDNSISHDALVNILLSSIEECCKEWYSNYASCLSDYNKFYLFINQDFIL